MKDGGLIRPARLADTILPARLLQGGFSGPCVVVGSGPSSKPLARWDGWQKVFSIGVNYSALKNPTSLYACQDRAFLDEARGRLRDRLGFFVLPNCLPPLQRPNASKLFRGFYCAKQVEPQPLDADDLALLKSSVALTGSLMVVAALLLGFSPVVVVGFDVAESYRYAHPHPGFRFENFHGNRRMQPQRDFLASLAERHRLINCSESDFAPRADLKQTFESLPENADESSRRLWGAWELNQ